jgi:hypothetical protein
MVNSNVVVPKTLSRLFVVITIDREGWKGFNTVNTAISVVTSCNHWRTGNSAYFDESGKKH